MIPLFILLAGLSLGQVQGLQAESDREALVARIKESLNAIDDGLMQAAEVEAVKTELQTVREAHMAAIRDIEELIKQLEYQFMSPQGGGGGSSSQNQQQQQDQQQQQQQSADDQRNQSAPEQQQQQGQEDQPSGSEADEQPTEGQPSGQPEPQPQSSSEGSVPPDPVGDFQRENTDGRWGLLPPKVQEQLNNMHVDDVPDRYRNWLDAYIRAMRKLEEP